MIHVERRAGSDVIIVAYAFWAVAALSRAFYQYLFRHPPDWLPTHLSAFAGGLYVLIIVTMRHRSPQSWCWAVALLALELAGVLGVGLADLVWHPFPYATVWSGFGAGYLYIPLVLPIAGLAWMTRRTTRRLYGIKRRV